VKTNTNKKNDPDPDFDDDSFEEDFGKTNPAKKPADNNKGKESVKEEKPKGKRLINMNPQSG
jgi:hypothetical protein